MGNQNARSSSAPDTIVLVHGLWVTPRSWEKWIDRYHTAGYHVLAPAYPGMEAEVEALNADPSPIEGLTEAAVVERYADAIQSLERRPTLIGHSFGGLVVQILLDHGFGAAGIAIDSVPPQGIRTLPASQAKAGFPVLKNPANRHRAVAFTPEQFHYAFTNTLTEEESAAVYERYHVPAPGRFVWDGVLANFAPGHHGSYVNFHNDDRAPLLLIAGEEDHLEPLAIQTSTAKRYEKSGAITELKQFPGRGHYIIGQPGWEEVADYALSWAADHALADRTPAPEAVEA